MERGLDFRERILEVPMLVFKGKRGTDLLEACGVLPLAQEPIGIQGGRKRKTPRIEAAAAAHARNRVRVRSYAARLLGVIAESVLNRTLRAQA